MNQSKDSTSTYIATPKFASVYLAKSYSKKLKDYIKESPLKKFVTQENKIQKLKQQRNIITFISFILFVLLLLNL